MKVVILGTGNVATVLARKIKQAGHEIIQVYGREESNATQLANEVQSDFITDLSKISRNGELYIIAVSDAAISLLADQLLLPGKIVVHTAASVAATVLEKVSTDYGVIYPLQSLRKLSTSIPEIPVFIDASNEKTLQIIQNFCQPVFASCSIASDSERLKLHVAAVLVSNFTNHLYTLADAYCKKELLNFNDLLPLMHETVERLNDNKPFDMQTGPAVRGDEITVHAHLALLQKYPAIQSIYEHLTRSIIELHRENQ